MNNLMQRDAMDHVRASAKKRTGVHPESLFSMALYDYDPTIAQYDVPAPPPAAPPLQSQSPLFHPVDEFRDLSLRELLSLSDDYLFGNDDPMANVGTQAGLGLGHSPLNPTLHASSMLSSAPPSFSSQPYPFSHDHSPPLTPSPPPPTPPITQEVLSGPSFEDECDIDGPVMESPPKKRRRTSTTTSSEDDGEEGPPGRRFRPYQAEQWAEKFDELCQYREKMGHCLVPHTYEENLPLARWVKRQRYQYKLFIDGKPSTMTHERAKALENIGFVWDSQGAAWGERLGELREFKESFSHCNVPSNFSDNPQLATWVKCQRRQYKLHQEGKPSNMTPERIIELETLGFEWELRSCKKGKSSSSSN